MGGRSVQHQCYDCGKMVAEDQVKRRDVPTQGRKKYNRTRQMTLHRVNLCVACDQQRSEDEANEGVPYMPPTFDLQLDPYLVKALIFGAVAMIASACVLIFVYLTRA